MKDFTDDEMNALLPKARPYSVVILRSGPNYAADDAGPIVWEHGRRGLPRRHAALIRESALRQRVSRTLVTWLHSRRDRG
jgi:hypothetical protein